MAAPPATDPVPHEILAECHSASDIGPTCIVSKDRFLSPLPDGHSIPECHTAMNIYDVCIEHRPQMELPEDPDLVPGDDAR